MAAPADHEGWSRLRLHILGLRGIQPPHTPDSTSHLILFHDTDLLKTPGFLGRVGQQGGWPLGGPGLALGG